MCSISLCDVGVDHFHIRALSGHIFPWSRHSCTSKEPLKKQRGVDAALTCARDSPYVLMLSVPHSTTAMVSGHALPLSSFCRSSSLQATPQPFHQNCLGTAAPDCRPERLPLQPPKGIIFSFLSAQGTACHQTCMKHTAHSSSSSSSCTPWSFCE